MSIEDNKNKLLKAINEIEEEDPSILTLLWGCLSSKMGKLSDNFIRKYHNELNWAYLLEHYKLPEDLLREFIYEIKDYSWEYVSIHQKLSEGFMREYQHRLYWSGLSRHQKFSEGFIIEFQNKVDWYSMVVNQKLSEDIMRKFRNKVSWYSVAGCQSNLSEDFVREFADRLNIFDVFKYVKMPEDFIRKYYDRAYPAPDDEDDEIQTEQPSLEPAIASVRGSSGERRNDVNNECIAKIRKEKEEEAKRKTEQEKMDAEKDRSDEDGDIARLRSENFSNNLDGVEVV